MYVRLCEGLNDYGKLIPQGENIYKHVKDQAKDYYVSVYKYNQTQKENFEKNHSVAGIKDVTTNTLVFDFDSKEIEESRRDTLEVIKRLKLKGLSEENMTLYFSGNKGFHLSIQTDKEFTPKQAKKTAINIAKGLKTFDSVVYNANRILRLPFTKHPESGLYKIPLLLDELKSLSIEEIQQIASDVYDPEIMVSKKVNSTLLFQEEKDEQKETPTILGDLNLAKRPKYLSPWKYALEQGFFPPGQRSNSLIILASTYKSLGYNKTKCYYSLKASADLQSQRFDQEKFSKDEIYKTIINQVYSNTWEGGTYAEDNFPEQLKDYLTEIGVPRLDAQDIHENFVMNIDGGFDSFAKYAENIDENTMKFGIADLDDTLRVQTGHLIGILAGPGIGKCLAKDTPVMLHNGDIVPVQDIKTGDLLMGDDSKPRKVLSTCKGKEMMYRVIPTKGDSYVVNESHILSLKYTSQKSRSGFQKNQIVNLSINEYFDLPESTRKKLKGYRVEVNFPEKKLDLDPYLIGLWLGDGTRKKPEITSCDIEIKEYLQKFCDNNNFKLAIYEREKVPRYNIVDKTQARNPFFDEIRTCLINGEKFIPEKYLKNSKKNRLKLLAGLIDSDGHQLNNCYEYVTKDRKLRDDVLYLCRSLGFAAYAKEKVVKDIIYHMIHISGQLDKVPVLLERKKCKPRRQIKDVLVTGITVEKLEKDDYYGFEIDGNSLFLLGDFTVTHNTSLALTLLNNTSKEGVKSFFASYDMAGNILIQKLVQRETRLTSEELYDVYRQGDQEQIQNFRKILNKNYSNVSFCFKSGQSVDELKDSIRKEEARVGGEIKLVIVDYLELIRAKSSDPTQASAEAIQGLREIANEGKVVVCLLQPNKLSSTPDEPLLTYNAAKGSSAIAQAVTAMITAHRPGYSSDFPEEDKYFSINIVKNRCGPLGKADFSWNGLTGRIGPLEDIEKQALAELRTLKKEMKGEQ